MTAGIFMFLASIAVWEFEEPPAVTNASTLSLSRETVSLGARSSAITIIFSVPPSLVLSSSPMQAISLFEMSFTSAALACIYASSIDLNIFENSSLVTDTAYSAFTS